VHNNVRAQAQWLTDDWGHHRAVYTQEYPMPMSSSSQLAEVTDPVHDQIDAPSTQMYTQISVTTITIYHDRHHKDEYVVSVGCFPAHGSNVPP
jgi:hypothetical protein